MPELAEHDVESSVGIRKCLGIAFDPHDVLVLRNPTVLASLFEQFRRKIQRRHPCSGPRSADSHHTGARSHTGIREITECAHHAGTGSRGPRCPSTTTWQLKIGR